MGNIARSFQQSRALTVGEREVIPDRSCKRCGAAFTPVLDRDLYCGRLCENNDSPRSRLRVLERDRFQCVCCGKHGKRDGSDLCVHRIVSFHDGGTNDARNVLTCCHRCAMSTWIKSGFTRQGVNLLDLIRDRNEAAGLSPEFKFNLGAASRDDYSPRVSQPSWLAPQRLPKEWTRE